MTKSTKSEQTNSGHERYDVLIACEYEHNGEKRTRWTRVGTGFSSRDGKGLQVELLPGLSVSGRLILRRDEKSQVE